MPGISTRDVLGVPPSRVGGAGYLLNVNAGSKVAGGLPGMTYSAYYGGGTSLGSWIDLCWHQGKLTVAHCELDSGLTRPWDAGQFAFRGPYVHQWNGAAWVSLGGEVDVSAGTPVPGGGTRIDPTGPRLASDGTNLFLSYVDHVVTDAVTGDTETWVRMARWNGAAWSDVAAFKVVGGITFYAPICANAGRAWAVFYSKTSLSDSGHFGNANFVVLRQDGTTSIDTPNLYKHSADANTLGGAPCCCVTTAGRAVGIYSHSNGNYAADSFRLLDLQTLTVVRETHTNFGTSPIVPYGVNVDRGRLFPSGFCSLYDGGKIVFGEQRHGAVIVPEDGGDDFHVLGGDDAYWTSNRGYGMSLTPDLVKPLQLFTFPGPTTAHTTWRDIYEWEGACTSERVKGNPLNSPAYKNYPQGTLPDINDPFLFADSGGIQFYGTASLVADASTVYAAVLYCGGGSGLTQDFWPQFIVYAYEIFRDVADCGAFQTPVFSSRLKHTPVV